MAVLSLDRVIAGDSATRGTGNESSAFALLE